MDDLILLTVAKMNPTGLKTRTGLGDLPYAPANFQTQLQFAFGTGAKQVQNLYDAQFVLAPSATQDLDLNGGGLVNAFGEAVVLAEVKAIFVKNTSAVDSITFGPAPAAGMSTLITAGGQLVIPPKGTVVMMTEDASGWLAAGGTDTLRIANGPTGSTTVLIALAGNA